MSAALFAIEYGDICDTIALSFTDAMIQSSRQWDNPWRRLIREAIGEIAYCEYGLDFCEHHALSPCENALVDRAMNELAFRDISDDMSDISDFVRAEARRVRREYD